jgi:hypothetical protein
MPTINAPSLGRSYVAMIRIASMLIVLLPLGAGLFACASQDEIKAERVAKQTATEAEDDTACRAAGEPGSQGYDTCRADKTAERARQADIDYQKARDFDRVLGGLDDL